MKARIIGTILLLVVLGAAYVMFGDNHHSGAPSSSGSSGLSIP